MLVRGVYSDLFLNPLQASNIEQIAFLRDIFEGLVIYDPQGNVVPAVAESWQTKDNKIWHFTLRKEAIWSNGEPVTAQQFVASWQRLAQSDSPLKHYLRYLNLVNAEKVLQQTLLPEQLGIVAENDRTLRLTLDKATPYLPQMLAHISLLPQYLSPHEGIVTNGAYQVMGQQGNLIHLEKNPQYWAKEKVAFKKCGLSENRTATGRQRLRCGVAAAATNGSNSILPATLHLFLHLNFNTPQLAQSPVRKALAMMTSARSLLPESKNRIPLTDNFLPISMQTIDSRWEQTPVEQLLSQARIGEKAPLKLTLSYDQSEVQSQLVQGLIRTWSQSDMIQIIGEGMPKQQLLENIAKGEFQIARAGWCADYNEPSAFLSLFYSRSPDNKSGYSNDELDGLFEQSLKVILPAERTALYGRIEQILQEENVVLPLYQSTVPVYLNPTLNGYDPANPTEVIYSKDLFRKVR
ncbi:LOW QUALITY PROTEIN: periplasmic oligopeptide-binding protein [Aggregatibacter actinomycetemcomitans ANH9381]|nr:LOW QUALITY PROTEIN: periplasmic oligopeptide-binding protein [Aggregatibacter actinomycetemcomitans ANH9381]